MPPLTPRRLAPLPASHLRGVLRLGVSMAACALLAFQSFAFAMNDAATTSTLCGSADRGQAPAQFPAVFHTAGKARSADETATHGLQRINRLMAEESAWTPLPSGLRIRDLAKGNGQQPTPGRVVYLQIKTYLSSGLLVDDTLQRRKPVHYVYLDGRMPPAFEEAIAGMKERGRRLVRFPTDMPYVSNAHLAEEDDPLLPENRGLVLEVSLMWIRDLETTTSTRFR